MTNATEAETYQDVRAWLRGLADRFLSAPDLNTVDDLANAISQHLEGRSAGWFSPLDPLFAQALRDRRQSQDPVQPNGGRVWWERDDDAPTAAMPPMTTHATPKVVEDVDGDLSDLIPSQRFVADQILDWLVTGKINGREESQGILMGYAGMGKTYMAGAIAAVAIKNGMVDPREVILVAPSHQARKVIRRMFSGRGLHLDTCTFAGLLGLTPEIDPDTGEEVYKPGEYTPKITGKTLVIGDEASQWSHRLQSYLDQQSQSDVQVLWMGDDAQLPPVESRRDRPTDQLNLLEPELPNESPLFDLPGWQLTEVVRYSGAIALLANDIRQNLSCPRLPLAEIRYYAQQDQTVDLLNLQDWHKVMIAAFKYGDIEDSPDQFRVLAWRNKRVAEINAAIHTARYGDNADPYCPGEVIIARRPCTIAMPNDNRNRLTLLHNGEQAVVIDAKRATVEGLSVWWLDCRKEPDDNGLTRVTLQVIDQCSAEDLDRRLKVLAEKAKAERDPSLRKRAWVNYYELKNQFHDVSLAYALTVHKSQGSTFGQVFVDLADIGCNRRDIKERNRMIYTAITRCSQQSILMHP